MNYADAFDKELTRVINVQVGSIGLPIILQEHTRGHLDIIVTFT